MRPLPIANPKNPWASSVVEYLDEPPPDAGMKIHVDASRSILSSNDSPDIGFTYSVNPYRGCFHGCAYCYARPSHEYLGFGAGTDFDRNIVIKPEAAALLRAAFDAPSWKGETVVFSGVTDCYQPIEASYGLTRACLEVCVAYKNPAAVITKAPLVERDLDLFLALTERASPSVTISLPFRDRDVARALEPYAASPERRLRTIEKFAAAGVRVGVNVAPFVPGLSEDEIGPLLRDIKDAGAEYAGWTMLRLPGSVAEVFEARIREALPLRAEKILARVRDVRGGKTNDSTFGVRMRGEGMYADAARALFESAARRVGLGPWIGGTVTPRDTFERPSPDRGQLRLF